MLESGAYANLFDLRQQLGADVVAACRFVNDLTRKQANTLSCFFHALTLVSVILFIIVFFL